jgi:hypothetical protein
MAFRIRNVTNSEADFVDPDKDYAKKISQPRFLHIEKYRFPDASKHVTVVPEKEQLVYDELSKKWKLIKNPTD